MPMAMPMAMPGYVVGIETCAFGFAVYGRTPAISLITFRGYG